MTTRRVELSGPHPGNTLVVDKIGPDDAPVVVWLHSEWGTYDDPPFASAVGDRVQTYVFHQPGWGLSTGEDELHTLTDVALAYWWAADELGLSEHVVLAGHGIGAAIAAEMAAQQPARIRQLVLASPFGLWDDEIGGVDFFALLPRDVAPHMYGDPTGPVAASQFPSPKTAHDKGIAGIRRAQTLGPASRYLYPLPDTGIGRRLYRLADVPVSLIWGERDGLAPIGLAAHWTAHLPHATVTTVPGAAHMVPYETEDVANAVLAGAGALAETEPRGD